MNIYVALLTAVLVAASMHGCKGQTKSAGPTIRTSPSGKIIGGGCDGCDIMYVGMPMGIDAVDTSAGWFEPGQKLRVSGTVYKPDGKTPAAGVLMYYWQTDNTGLYTSRQGMPEKARPHGHVRGWVRTDDQGRYSICSVKPAPYPGETMPAHIHAAIKEPDLANEYYIDDFVFDDDPFVTTGLRKTMENRGGNGILRTRLSNGVLVASRDITLGLHIPHYPK